MERFMYRRCALLAGKLVLFNSVPLERTWGFSLPTLCKKGRFTSRLPWATDTQSVVAHIASKHPTLVEILKASNGKLALKGGCFSSLLLGKEPNDFDLYVVGVNSHEEAAEVVQQALRSFVSITKKRAEESVERVVTGRRKTVAKQGGEEMTTEEIERMRSKTVHYAVGALFGIRRQGVVTVTGINGIDVPVQISLSPYSTLSSCVEDSDVDIGAMALADVDEGIVMAERAAFALQNWALRNEASSGFLSPERLVSYFDRGFDVILPQLDLSKIQRRAPRIGIPTSFELCGGQLLVEVDGELSNRINVLALKHRERRGGAMTKPGEVESDDPSSVKGIRQAKGNRRKAIKNFAVETVRHNALELLHKGFGFYAVAYGTQLENLADIRKLPATLRNVETTLHHASQVIEKDPFSSSALLALMKSFPVVSATEQMGRLMPTIEWKGELDEFVRNEMAKVTKQQMELAAVLVEEAQKQLSAKPIKELLNRPPIYQCTTESYYGNALLAK